MAGVTVASRKLWQSVVPSLGLEGMRVPRTARMQLLAAQSVRARPTKAEMVRSDRMILW